MELTKIVIKNYKSIEFAEIQIDKVGNSYLKILLGKNESGKSNILEAIDIKQKYSNSTSSQLIVDDVRRQDLRSHDEICVEYFFRVDPSDIEDKYGAYYPFIINRVREYGRGDIFKSILKEYSAEFAIEKYSFSRISNSNKYNVSRTVRVEINKKEGRNNYYKSSTFNVTSNDLIKTTFITNQKYKSIDNHQKNSFTILKDNEISIIHRVILYEYLLKKFPVFQWEFSNRYIIHNPVSVDSFLENIESYPLLKCIFCLDDCDSESKIKEKFNSLKLSNERVSYEKYLSQKITKKIKEIWKDSNIIFNVRLENNEIITTIKEDNNDQIYIDLKDRSSGFKQIITLLFDLLFYVNVELNKKSLILIDEPENHLHPSAIKELFEFILSFGIQNYAIVSTHSPFFLDKRNTSRHNIVEKEKGHTTLSYIDEKKFVFDDYVTNTCFGFNIWDEILGTKFILVEGCSDKIIISKLIEDINLHHDINVMSANGSNIVRIVKFIKEVHNNFIVIVDGDDEGENYKKKIKLIEPSIYCLSLNDIYADKEKCTIEDWVKRDFILNEVNLFLDDLKNKSEYDIIKSVKFSLSNNKSFIQNLSIYLNMSGLLFNEHDKKEIKFIADSIKVDISDKVKVENVIEEATSNLREKIRYFFCKSYEC